MDEFHGGQGGHYSGCEQPACHYVARGMIAALFVNAVNEDVDAGLGLLNDPLPGRIIQIFDMQGTMFVADADKVVFEIIIVLFAVFGDDITIVVIDEIMEL